MLNSCAPSRKNGRFSGKARLEGGQVDFRRIGFDLAEVRVDRGFERQVRAEAHLDVGADAALQVRAVVERVAAIAIAVDGRSAGDVRQRLDAARRDDAVDAADVAEARRPGAHGARNQDPVVGFVERRPEAIQVEAPGLVGARVEAQLRERNPQLGGPLIARHVGLGAPHRVEPGVEGVLLIARVIAIDAHAGGGHAEDDGGAAIEEGVERDQDVLGLIGAVAAAERRLDAAVACCASARRHTARHRRRRAALPSHRSARRPRSAPSG